MGIKRDKKKKAEKKRQNQIKNNQTKELSQFEIEKGLETLFNPKKLTTPTKINSDILEVCQRISSFEPFFIQITPEKWSRQSCCDLNVHEYIKSNGGQIICGYKVWYNAPNYIELERHALWFKDGIYKDITFNTDGEESILFLPDVAEKQSSLEDNKTKIRWGKDSKTRLLIKHQEYFESLMPIQQMSHEACWNTMLTYEQWTGGERMSNMQLLNS